MDLGDLMGIVLRSHLAAEVVLSDEYLVDETQSQIALRQEFSSLIQDNPTFGDVENLDATVESFRNPRVGTLSELASKYTLPSLTSPGRYTRAKIRENLMNSARAINRKYGLKWTEGALEEAVPAAANQLSKTFQIRADRVFATYLSILQMPAAFDKFTEMRALKSHIKRRDIRQARAAKQRCGIFPFC